MRLKLFYVFLFSVFANQLFSIQQLCPIIPKPAEISVGDGSFVFDKNTSIIASEGLDSSVFQLRKMLKNTGFNFPCSSASKNVLSLKIDKNLISLTDEGYLLKVSKTKIEITASHTKGLYYGFVSLLQLLPSQIYSNTFVKGVKWKIPAVSIQDQPRFAWRAVMLDVSRQFFAFDFLKKYVDWMSIHKINVFHIHLTDNQGWRIEIKKYPELTNKGAWRGENEILRASNGSGKARYGGFYTQEQLKELVRYAAERNVHILPEIDMPGHARAIVASYPLTGCTLNANLSKNDNVLCAARDSNFTMIEDILKEVTAIFPFEYIHIGGDEVDKSFWKNCSNCQQLMKDKGFTELGNIQNYFVKRLEDIVTKQGKKMIGWNEIMEGGELKKSTAVMAWNSLDVGYEIAKKGYQVVLAPNEIYYIDKRQAIDERGWVSQIITTKDIYDFNPMANNKLTNDELKNIVGIEACLWSEKLDQPFRYAEFMTYPRLCALAETAWSPQLKRDWADFSDRMGTYHFSRLSQLGINYRLFSPTAKVENDLVTIIPPYKNAVVRYTLDGTEPGVKSAIYSKPLKTTNMNAVYMKTFAVNGYTSPSTKGIDRPAIAHWEPKDVSTTLKEMEFDVTKQMNQSGNWFVEFRFVDGATFLISSVKLYENGVLISQDNHAGNASIWTSNNIYRLPLLTYSDKAIYTVKASVRGDKYTRSSGDIYLSYGKYTEPEMTVETNMSAASWSNKDNTIDWNRSTNFVTANVPQKGDYFTFTFKQAFKGRLSIVTGALETGLNTLSDATLEISVDGLNFKKVAEFDNGTVQTALQLPIKAARLSINEPQKWAIQIQDIQLH
jgi:hexosaminidase